MVSLVEVTFIKTYSRKTIKLGNIYNRSLEGLRTSSRNGKLNISLVIDTSKFKSGGWVQYQKYQLIKLEFFGIYIVSDIPFVRNKDYQH